MAPIIFLQLFFVKGHLFIGSKLLGCFSLAGAGFLLIGFHGEFG